jgi:hypothetical protein
MGPSPPHARRLGRNVSDRTTSNRSTGYRLRRGVVVALGVVALGLSACGNEVGGGSDDTGSKSSEQSGAKGAEALKAVQLAATTSQKKSTANFTMTMDVTADGEKVPLKATGQIDGANNAVKLEMTMSVPGQGSMKLKQIVKGKTIYMTGIPGMPKNQWVKLSLDEIGAAAGGGATSGLGTGSDPADQLKLLMQVSDDVRADGKATVNGVETTKYVGTIDLEKASAASGADAKELAEIRKQYQDLSLTKIPFELYVDGDNLPSRMTMKMDGSSKAGGKTEKFAMTSQMDFTDWGTDVKITTPKKAVSFEELLSNLGGGATP